MRVEKEEWVKWFKLLNMVEATAANKNVSQEEIEREVARRYQVLQQESQTLLNRVMELEDERKENQ